MSDCDEIDQNKYLVKIIFSNAISLIERKRKNVRDMRHLWT